MLSAHSAGDEVASFRDVRYFGAAEACWRVLKFPLFLTQPSVDRLPLHLHEGQPVYHRAGREEQAAHQGRSTKLLDWLYFCRAPVTRPPPVAHYRTLTYLQFPGYFKHDATSGWTARRRQMRYRTVGRLPPVHLTLENEEQFYLRILLCHLTVGEVHTLLNNANATVAPSVNHLRAPHATFKAACVDRGLAQDDNEWLLLLAEARTYEMPSQLLQLLLFILIYNTPLDPDALIDSIWDAVVDRQDDADGRVAAVAQRVGVHEHDVRQVATMLRIREELQHLANGANVLSRLQPFPSNATDERIVRELEVRHNEPREIRLELDYNREAQLHAYAAARASIDEQPSQAAALRNIIAAVESERPYFAFISAPPGCGKTFLIAAILNYCRGNAYIVIAVASTGIAALLLEGGTTLHSKLRAPLTVSFDTRLNVRALLLSPPAIAGKHSRTPRRTLCTRPYVHPCALYAAADWPSVRLGKAGAQGAATDVGRGGQQSQYTCTDRRRLLPRPAQSTTRTLWRPSGSDGRRLQADTAHRAACQRRADDCALHAQLARMARRPRTHPRGEPAWHALA